ncbi:MAG TPA: energy transducer TonB, partial [Sphingopyxis sp.]|nr:energy transducer TonB [Sphingopyxis sp.]
MTLIPLISAIVAAPEATTAPAGAALRLERGGYDPGARHRPLAAALAVGLPVAMVVAVALSPMIVVTPPKSAPTIGTLIEIEKPKPPETQEAPPQTQPAQSTMTVTESPLQPVALDPVVVAPQPPYVPPAGTGSGPPTVVETPVAPPPKLVLAQLDQRHLGAFQPDYPLREQREGIEGVARVRVLIGTDGRVKAVELVSTDSPGFFEATKKRALA